MHCSLLISLPPPRSLFWCAPSLNAHSILNHFFRRPKTKISSEQSSIATVAEQVVAAPRCQSPESGMMELNEVLQRVRAERALLEQQRLEFDRYMQQQHELFAQRARTRGVTSDSTHLRHSLSLTSPDTAISSAIQQHPVVAAAASLAAVTVTAPSAPAASDAILLNVGGILFQLSRADVQRHPDSLLAQYFCDAPHALRPAPDGVYHLPDRSPDTFVYVAAFLQQPCTSASSSSLSTSQPMSPTAVVLPSNPAALQQLMHEASFYRLNSLTSLAQSRLTAVCPGAVLASPAATVTATELATSSSAARPRSFAEALTSVMSYCIGSLAHVVSLGALPPPEPLSTPKPLVAQARSSLPLPSYSTAALRNDSPAAAVHTLSPPATLSPSTTLAVFRDGPSAAPRTSTTSAEPRSDTRAAVVHQHDSATVAMHSALPTELPALPPLNGVQQSLTTRASATTPLFAGGLPTQSATPPLVPSDGTALSLSQAFTPDARAASSFMPPLRPPGDCVTVPLFMRAEPSVQLLSTLSAAAAELSSADDTNPLESPRNPCVVSLDPTSLGASM